MELAARSPPAPVLPRGQRVAIFSGAYQHIIDGVSMTLNRLARRLEAQGHKVLVFCPTTPISPLSAEALAAAEIESVPSVQAPFRPEYRMALGLGVQGRARLAAFAPTIVHVATPDLLGTEAQTWAIERKVPVVCSYHTHFATYVKYYNLGIFEGPLWAYMSAFYYGCEQVYVPAPEVGVDLEQHGLSLGKTLPWRRGVNASQFTPRRRDARRWRREVLAPAIAAKQAAAAFGADSATFMGGTTGKGKAAPQQLVSRPSAIPGVTAGAVALVGDTSATGVGGLVDSAKASLAAAAARSDPLTVAALAEKLEAAPVLLVACRMVWEKGLEDVAAVDAMLRARGVRFTMVVVGDGPARVGLARKMPEAVFMGTMTSTELWSTYANADAYLMPSRTETFGATVLEAMASGVPVIVAANASGTSRLVAEGAGYKCDTPEAMALAAERLLTDVPLRDRMGAAALHEAHSYDWDRIFGELEESYARVLIQARGAAYERHARAAAARRLEATLALTT
jgi:glycosyltransferase involved in cell wall biosynthesis